MVKPGLVNLIPREALERPFLRRIKLIIGQNKGLRNFGLMALALVLASLIQTATLAGFRLRLASSKAAMQDARAKLNQLQSQYLQLEKLKSSLTKEELQKKQRLDLLLSTSSQGRRFYKLLALIPELTPPDLWINHLVLSEAEIQIIGSTLNNQLVAQFMGRLDQSGAFKNSRFTSSEKQVLESHTIYNFQVSAEGL